MLAAWLAARPPGQGTRHSSHKQALLGVVWAFHVVCVVAMTEHNSSAVVLGVMIENGNSRARIVGIFEV